MLVKYLDTDPVRMATFTGPTIVCCPLPSVSV